jgi:hypothetical protein
VKAGSRPIVTEERSAAVAFDTGVEVCVAEVVVADPVAAGVVTAVALLVALEAGALVAFDVAVWIPALPEGVGVDELPDDRQAGAISRRRAIDTTSKVAVRDGRALSPRSRNPAA